MFNLLVVVRLVKALGKEEDDYQNNENGEAIFIHISFLNVLFQFRQIGQMLFDRKVVNNLINEAVGFVHNLNNGNGKIGNEAMHLLVRVLDIWTFHIFEFISILRRLNHMQQYKNNHHNTQGSNTSERIKQLTAPSINQSQMNINESAPAQIFDEPSNQPEQQVEKKDLVQQFNPIRLLKKPDEFKQSFFGLLDVATEALKQKKYDRSVAAYNKCVDMLDLGKNILKDINQFCKLVVYGNLACGYHYTRKLAKCNKFCEKIKEELERILARPIQKELFLKLSKMLVKLKFQHCAILSQLEEHDKAFQLCKSTVPMLVACVEMLLAYVKTNSALDMEQRKTSEMVQFKRQVYDFAENILNNLLICLNQPLKRRQGNSFYYWQKNVEQNEEQVKKKFIPNSPSNNNCKRSILGVSKSTHWIDEFNIGKIMHFSEMSISDFEDNVPMEENIFKDKLYELVIYCSMANFTMATELRLIESARAEKAEKQEAEAVGGLGHVNLMKKYGYEEKSEIFKLSEIYHTRAIEIMTQNIRTTVPYITHILRSYQKHYIDQKQVLEPIVAIVQESLVSINQSRDVKHRTESACYQNEYDDYMRKTKQKGFQKLQTDYNENLLLQSQFIRQPQAFNKVKPESQQPQVNLAINSLVNTQKGVKEDIQPKLMMVKSNPNLHRGADVSKREDLNNSDQYLKSNQIDLKRKTKLSLVRSKSKNKAILNRQTSAAHLKQTKKQIKAIQKKSGVHTQRIYDHKLKTDRHQSKAKDRQKYRKGLKKQKLLDLDLDRYGQREIKIKTESCTHIKVVYKKKK